MISLRPYRARCPRLLAAVVMLSLLGTGCGASTNLADFRERDGSANGASANGAGGAAEGAGGRGVSGSSSGGSATASGGTGSGATPATGGTMSSGGSQATGGAGGADSPPAGWKLLFSDEFNGPNGGAVDPTKWALVNKGDGFGNGELQYYTPRKENSGTDGTGALVIHALKESYMGKNYTSAKLMSTGKFEFQYGRAEMRAKLPYGQGLWPAYWMLGSNSGSVGWPTCGEIDIMENRGREPSTVHGSLHGPGYSGGNPLTGQTNLPSGQKFQDDFHTFAVEWEENVVRFYLDDRLYETRTPANVPAGKKWVFDHKFYLILNVAVGGQFGGSPDGTTTFPQTMIVDYVRVYQR